MIEDEDHAEAFLKFGITSGQGYLFGKPSPDPNPKPAAAKAHQRIAKRR
jgi:EAL domain-containing protein (putative c-di-GMP-specific phosphodiesterase class I)